MKPQGGLTLPKEIGNTLTEAQIPALDRLGAAAALGAAAGSGFKQLTHAGRILAGRQGANRAAGRHHRALRVHHSNLIEATK
jgi:hypothetical protein